MQNVEEDIGAAFHLPIGLDQRFILRRVYLDPCPYSFPEDRGNRYLRGPLDMEESR